MKEVTEEQIKQMAKVCHQANKAYCETIGDSTQSDWEQAPEWQQQSAINGVKYRLQYPDATPCDMHRSWMREKVEQGWIYGPVKDADLKEHPCLVPYSELPKEQQIKDHLFSNIVKALS